MDSPRSKGASARAPSPKLGEEKGAVNDCAECGVSGLEFLVSGWRPGDRAAGCRPLRQARWRFHAGNALRGCAAVTDRRYTGSGKSRPNREKFPLIPGYSRLIPDNPAYGGSFFMRKFLPHPPSQGSRLHPVSARQDGAAGRSRRPQRKEES